MIFRSDHLEAILKAVFLVQRKEKANIRQALVSKVPARDLAPVAHQVPVLLVSRHLDVVGVGAVVTVPKQQPHGVQGVGLSKLDHQGSGPELVTSRSGH